ncbi:MAG: helix-hairpin-helix domain-containing protein [Ignavibacteria bacterium]|nr:helix-hairpin-helix domain-containing protein [Ignavibacteria bacterium]
MWRFINKMQTHIGFTSNESLVLLWLTILLTVGSLGSMIVPEAPKHGHVSAQQLLNLIDSIDSRTQPIAREQEASIPAITTTKPTSKGPSPVRINVASKTQLEQLPGVGPATAELIITARTQRKFTSIEDLLDIKGIGKKKLEKMRPYIILP